MVEAGSTSFSDMQRQGVAPSTKYAAIKLGSGWLDQFPRLWGPQVAAIDGDAWMKPFAKGFFCWGNQAQKCVELYNINI